MSLLVVLDLDGTLVDSGPDLAAALNRVLAARGIADFSLPEVTAMVGDGAAALVNRAFAARDLPQDAAALPDFLADYGANAAVVSRLYPDVVETLAAMQARGWTLAVCTNKPAAPAHVLLAALGIAQFFAAVGGGDSFPARKPDPAHLRATIAAAGGDLSHAIMVGDHHNDIAAAAGAGVPSIFAAWGYGQAADGRAADAIAVRFSDLPSMIATILQG